MYCINSGRSIPTERWNYCFWRRPYKILNTSKLVDPRVGALFKFSFSFPEGIPSGPIRTGVRPLFSTVLAGGRTHIVAGALDKIAGHSWPVSIGFHFFIKIAPQGVAWTFTGTFFDKIKTTRRWWRHKSTDIYGIVQRQWRWWLEYGDDKKENYYTSASVLANRIITIPFQLYIFE